MCRRELADAWRFCTCGAERPRQCGLEIGLIVRQRRFPTRSPDEPILDGLDMAVDHGRSDNVIQELGTASNSRPNRLKQDTRVERISLVMLGHGFDERRDELIAVLPVEDS